MSNLMVRALTAVIAGGVAVTAIILSVWGLFVCAAVISILGLLEFYRITDLKTKRGKWLMLGFAGLTWVFIAMAYLFPNDSLSMRNLVMAISSKYLMIVMVVSSAAAILMLWEKQVKQPLKEAGLLFFGLLYTFFPIVLLFTMSLDMVDPRLAGEEMERIVTAGEIYDFRVVLGILFLTWAVDTFAYFGGKYLGKNKLWERISPKKTWEGTIAGAVACLALGFGLEQWWPQGWSWIVVACVIAVVSQLGDLVESMYKRGLKIKDSGGILPGHGGIMDRFDGMYVTLPIVYLYLQFFQISEAWIPLL
ncbi:MAG: phosphatidate cytidylyltransferase [Bacteroidota bacterium]